MGRAPCCDKTRVKRGPWSPEEDVLLESYITKNGIGGNWISLPQRAGLNRCKMSCRLRWLNYLKPNIKHGGFTEKEDKKVGIAEKNWVPQASEIKNMNWVSPSPYYHDIPSGSGQLSASLSSSGATTRASSSSSTSATLSEETNSFGGCSSSSWAPVESLMMNCKLEENNVVEGGECKEWGGSQDRMN